MAPKQGQRKRKDKVYRLQITTLSRGRHDQDIVLPHAAFQTLVDFERENAEHEVDWNHSRHLLWKEIQSLYHWWTVERPNRNDKTECAREEGHLRAADQRNLIRLVKIRPVLWI